MIEGEKKGRALLGNFVMSVEMNDRPSLSVQNSTMGLNDRPEILDQSIQY